MKDIDFASLERRMMTPFYTVCLDDFDVETFINGVPWGEYTATRKECFMASTPMSYTYGSGKGIRTYTSIPYSEEVLAIQDRVNKRFGTDYNVCFLNRYDDKGKHLGWHSDNSPEVDQKHPIGVASFGAERDLCWKLIGHKGPVPDDQKKRLAHGSFFVMPAGFQDIFQHKIAKSDHEVEIRVSLTFRRYKV